MVLMLHMFLSNLLTPFSKPFFWLKPSNPLAFYLTCSLRNILTYYLSSSNHIQKMHTRYKYFFPFAQHKPTHCGLPPRRVYPIVVSLTDSARTGSHGLSCPSPRPGPRPLRPWRTQRRPYRENEKLWVAGSMEKSAYVTY